MSNTPKISDIKIVEKDWMPDGKFALVSPNTESYKSIDELIKEALFHKTESQKREAVAKLIYSLLMEVIGDHKDDGDLLNYKDTNGFIIAETTRNIRNQLRAEQRQKLNKLFNKEK